VNHRRKRRWYAVTRSHSSKSLRISWSFSSGGNVTPAISNRGTTGLLALEDAPSGTAVIVVIEGTLTYAAKNSLYTILKM
jgi:hypothetical protein